MIGDFNISIKDNFLEKSGMKFTKGGMADYYKDLV